MSDKYKNTVRRIFDEVWCNGNVDYIHKTFSPDVNNRTTTPGNEPGIDGIVSFASDWKRAFSDTTINITNQWTDNDCVCTCWTANAVNEGPYDGKRPTNKNCTFTGITVYRFDKNGTVCEVWEEYDRYTLMQQIGAIPATPTPTPTR